MNNIDSNFTQSQKTRKLQDYISESEDKELLMQEFNEFLKLRAEQRKKSSQQQVSAKKDVIHFQSQDEEENLDKNSLQIINMSKILTNVESDGNCLYRSVSVCLTNSELGWDSLKKFWLMMVYLQFNQITLRDEQLNWDKSRFYEHFIRNSVWGDIDLKGLVLSSILKRKIFLWIGNQNLNRKPDLIYGETQEYKKQPVLIFYNGINHFKAVQILDKNKRISENDNFFQDWKQIYIECLDNFFNDFIEYTDPEIGDQIDEDFYQDVSFCEDSIANILEIFSKKFGYDFLSEKRSYQAKRRSQKIDNMNNIPKDIFTQNDVKIEGFNCCNYNKIYPNFQNRQNCDTYNEKYQYLLSVKPGVPMSNFWYPKRITDIKQSKKKNDKMYDFRLSLKGYKLVKCQLHQNECDKTLRLVSTTDKKLKFHLFQDQVQDFLHLFHGKQHRKRDEMLQIFDKLGIFSPSMSSQIQQKIQSCDICQMQNVSRKRKSCKMIISQSPFERVQIDCCEIHKSLQQKGFNQILVVRDHFSRFTKAYPLKNKAAQTIKANLQQFFNFGIPEILQQDNGREFKNQIIQTLCEQYDINFIHGRPYHPQSQGSVERFNRWIHLKLIQMKLDEDEDDQFDLEQSLIQLCISYNQKKTRITGYKPQDVIKLDKENDQEKLEQILATIQSSYAKSKNPLDFEINQKALLNNRVTCESGKNSIIQKYSLKKKTGELILYNIPVTVLKVNSCNVTIKIDKANNADLEKDSQYLCPTMYLKSVQQECWEKFIDKDNENQKEEETLLDLDQIKEIEDEEEYDLTPKSDIDFDKIDQNADAFEDGDAEEI